MALLKKTNDAWQPSEKPDLQIGEVLEMTDYESLVKQGMAVLVDPQGNELELPGQVFKCPICFTSLEGVMELTMHIGSHLKKNQEAMEEQIIDNSGAVEGVAVDKINTEEANKRLEEVKKEIAKQNRIDALARAREAKKAKKTASK